MKNLNKKIARFSYRGNIYELEYFSDVDTDNYKKYGIYHYNNCIAHIATSETKKGRLIELAKNELSDLV